MNEQSPSPRRGVIRDKARKSSLVDRAKRLTEFLLKEAPRNEVGGRLTDATVKVLRDEELFFLFVPRSFGGAEVWPLEALEVVEALSYADGSTGWVVMATQVSMGSAAAYLAPSAAKEVFGKTIPLIAGQGAPVGRADIESGGYRLNGSWTYGSGLLHSDWVHTGAMVHEAGSPRKYPGTRSADARILIVPVAQAELKNNWDVLGLRATGSIDYAIKGVFVPEDFTHRLNADRPHQGGDLYRLGIPGFATVGHTGFALGVARRALDEIAALAMAPSGRPSSRPEIGGGESFLEQYGNAEAQLHAARALAFRAWDDIQSNLTGGNDMSVRQLTLARLSLNYATSVASQISSLAFKFGGGAATRAGTLQRCYRDQMTGAQHITTSPSIVRDCAKELLGLSKGKVWSLRQMIEPD
jgi:alkylation response protein AidB-like acyl-CoA dehydrogenase